MNNQLNDVTFDEFIAAAMNESFDREESAVPSKETLNEMYSYSKQSLRSAQRKLSALKRKIPAAVFYLSRVAVVALVVSSLCTAVLLTNAEAKSYVNRLLFATLPDHNTYDFGIIDDLPEAEKDLHDLTIGYIPEGYELVSSEEDIVSRDYLYTCEGDKSILIYISNSDNLSISVDNEHSTYETKNINGFTADIYYDENDGSGTIIIATNNYIIDIYGCLTSKEEIIKIAENIK